MTHAYIQDCVLRVDDLQLSSPLLDLYTTASVEWMTCSSPDLF